MKNVQMCQKYRIIFILMDLMVVSSCIFNFGAAYLTGMMAVREHPEAPIMETNPVVATIQGYELHPDYWNVVRTLLFHLVIWFIIGFLYIFYRLKIDKPWHLCIQFAMVFMYFSILGYDFFNDLGFSGWGVC